MTPSLSVLSPPIPTQPDHATLSEFRRRFLNEFADIFVQVLALAHEMKMLKLGQVSVDGSKIHADASRHSALSYGHIEKLEAQFKQEVKQLIALAEDADQAKIPEGMNLPDEIKRREKRLMQMDQAKQEIEKRAKARYEREKAEYDAKMAERAEKEKTSGKKPRGKVPQAPDPTARAEDQVNLTDEESRIMKCHGGAFEQCFNAQAAVDTQSYLIVAAHVTQASNDKQQVEPMLKQLKALPEQMGKVDQALMDTGYYSERNIELCEKNQIEPYIAVGRDAHHPDAMSRFSEPAPLPEGATRVEKMRHTLKIRAGRAVYAVRKSTVEPVLGIIKSVMGFRQFSVRGLEKANGEWSLVCLAWHCHLHGGI